MVTGDDYVDRFRSHAGLIEWSPVELRNQQLEPGFSRILHVAALLEEDTAITVRQARSLGLLRSDDLALFLPLWEIEESEHGRALRCLLAHQRYDAPTPSTKTIALRRRVVAHLPARAFARLPQTPFLFCVLGAAAEYLATTIYAELAKQADSTEVERLLRAVARQEARHFSFFLAGARRRGHEMTALNGRLARRALQAVWEPIGVPTLGLVAWQDMFGHWLEDDHFRGRMLMMDSVIDSVPHLEGAGLMGHFLEDLS